MFMYVLIVTKSKIYIFLKINPEIIYSVSSCYFSVDVLQLCEYSLM